MKKEWPTILYFGNDWFGDNRTSSHHIARLLGKEFRIVYIECPGLRAPKGSSRDIKKIFSKVKKSLAGVRILDQKFFLFTIFQIPFHKIKFLRAVNRFIIISSLKGLCRKLKIKNPILWFVVPHLADVLGKIDEQLVVYYCIDDYASLPGVNKEMIQKMDAELTKKADIVFVSAEPLLESKQKFNPRVILSRHGVDFEHFNQACSLEMKIADEVKSLKKPVIGFFGLIETWVDLDLIKFLAEARPDWNFLMIGRVAVSANPCESLSNVHFIGSKKYEVLPHYAKIFDAAIIPCKLNKLIINFNPLKLREYLAMGKPVVTIRVPEVEAFSDVVEIADTYQEFLEKLDFVLSHDNPGKMQKRLEKVRDSSWELKVKAVTAEVDKILQAKVNY